MSRIVRTLRQRLPAATLALLGLILIALSAARPARAAQVVTATVPVGAPPAGIAIDNTHRRMYVLTPSVNTVKVINTNTGAIVAPTISISPGGSGIAVDPVRNRLFVTYFCGGCGSAIEVYDTVSGALLVTTPLGSGAAGVAVNPTNGKVYVAEQGSLVVRALCQPTYAVCAVVTGFPDKPYDLAINPLTNRIYVAIYTASSLSVIDGASDSLITTFAVNGGNPTSVAVNPLTNRVYVGKQIGNGISVVDGSTNTYLTDVTVGDAPILVRADSGTNRVYVGIQNFSTVVVVDGATNTVVPPAVPVGVYPSGLDVDTTKRCAWVSVLLENAVKQICDRTADISVTKTGPAGPLTVGAVGTYTITVTNNGPDAAPFVTVTDTLPPEMTYISHSPAAACAFNSGTRRLTCSWPSIPFPGSKTVTIRVRAATPGTATNTACAQSSPSDPNSANDCSSPVVTQIVPLQADLRLAVVDAPDPVRVNTALTYTLVVSNDGPDSATSVVVTTDPLPLSVTFLSAAAGCSFNGGTRVVTCTAASLALTNKEFRIRVKPAATGTLSIGAHVTSATLDPNATNNDATASTTVAP